LARDALRETLKYAENDPSLCEIVKRNLQKYC